MRDRIKNITNKKVKKEKFISDKEMEELKHLLPSLRKGLKQAKEGKYKIVS